MTDKKLYIENRYVMYSLTCSLKILMNILHILYLVEGPEHAVASSLMFFSLSSLIDLFHNVSIS